MKREQASVRVVAGRFGGRTLAYPSGRIMRPTMGRVREAVFSSLMARVPGAVFLDLYCAGGAMGIEALSRGASFVHFVENDPRSLEALHRNLEELGIGPREARVHGRDAGAVLAALPASFDPAPGIVYADPPYDSDEAKLVLSRFDANPYPEFGLLLVEHGPRPLDAATSSLRATRERRFGDAVVTWFEREGSPGA